MPLHKSYEVWNLKLTNLSELERNLTITGYAEFTNVNNYENEQANTICDERAPQLFSL